MGLCVTPRTHPISFGLAAAATAAVSRLVSAPPATALEPSCGSPGQPRHLDIKVAHSYIAPGSRLAAQTVPFQFCSGHRMNHLPARCESALALCANAIRATVAVAAATTWRLAPPSASPANASCANLTSCLLSCSTCASGSLSCSLRGCVLAPALRGAVGRAGFWAVPLHCMWAAGSRWLPLAVDGWSV